jgi:SlyX protein
VFRKSARDATPSHSPPRLPAAAWQNDFMADEHSRRTEKLESNLAHLEHQVEQLNGVVIEQGKLLERLKKEVQRQSSAMETLELERIKSNNVKPPHH